MMVSAEVNVGKLEYDVLDIGKGRE